MSADPVLVVSAGSFTLRGRPLYLGVPLPSVLSMTDPGGAGSLPVVPAAQLLDPAAAADGERASSRGRRLVVLSHNGRTCALLVDEVIGVDTAEHWAPASLLEPIDHTAFQGAIPRSDRWLAVVDPAAL